MRRLLYAACCAGHAACSMWRVAGCSPACCNLQKMCILALQHHGAGCNTACMFALCVCRARRGATAHAALRARHAALPLPAGCTHDARCRHVGRVRRPFGAAGPLGMRCRAARRHLLATATPTAAPGAPSPLRPWPLCGRMPRASAIHAPQRSACGLWSADRRRAPSRARPVNWRLFFFSLVWVFVCLFGCVWTNAWACARRQARVGRAQQQRVPRRLVRDHRRRAVPSRGGDRWEAVVRHCERVLGAAVVPRDQLRLGRP